MSRSATEVLSHWVASRRPGELPAALVHEAKRCLMNFMATALAGCRDPAILQTAQVLEPFRASYDCTVIGHVLGSDARHASSLNAMSGNVFDFDDTHMPTILHPTAPVAPALFALAQTRRMSGLELLSAFAVGVEIECRLALAVSPEHYARGWHITSTCGVFGSAAAVGNALGLNAQHIAWALGHASAQAGGLVETLGSMAKSVGVGNAASNGLLAGLLGQAGVQGPDHPIEGPRGFLQVMGSGVGDERMQPLLSQLGERWELTHNTYKPYPCGVVLNPVIEACLALYHGEGIRLGQVAQVTLRGHPLLRQRTDRPHPATGREAQVSAHQAVVACLAQGLAGLDEFSDASVKAWAAQRTALDLEFIDDPAVPVEAAYVQLRLHDGRVIARHVQQAGGSLALPMSDADLERKLVELSAWGGSGVNPQPLIDAIWMLDQSEDAAAMVRRAAAPH